MRRPFCLFLLLLAFKEQEREREGRTLAASARFQDNYLYQIGSRPGFHGGKQKNPPLARMLTRRQGKKKKKKKKRKKGERG